MDSYMATTASRNGKTGPILVTTSHKGTCPDACPLKAKGCYAKYSNLGAIWSRLTETAPGDTFKNGNGFIRTLSWKDMLRKIRQLHKGALWRHNQAGDLPGDGERIDPVRMRELIRANKGKRGFTYTHYPPTEHNLALIREANDNGFTVNLSADSLEEADALYAHGLPVACIGPEGQRDKVTTPGGNKGIVCPAYTKGLQCSSCKLCAVRDRKSIVIFPAHGAARKFVEQIFNA